MYFWRDPTRENLQNCLFKITFGDPSCFIAICREDYLALGSDQGVDGDYYLVVASVITLQIIQEQL